MARTGLTKSQVRACRDRLLAEGRYPSVDALRQALGDTGSKSTIHRLLKELAGEDAGAGTDAGLNREDTARSLHDIVEQLADRLHDDARQRIRRLEAAHAQALREKESELAALRAAIARLEARVEASRGGSRAISPFSMMAACARSEVFDVDSMRPPALKCL